MESAKWQFLKRALSLLPAAQSCWTRSAIRPVSASGFQPLGARQSSIEKRSTVAIPVRLRVESRIFSQANLSWAKGEGIVAAAFDRRGPHSGDRR